MSLKKRVKLNLKGFLESSQYQDSATNEKTQNFSIQHFCTKAESLIDILIEEIELVVAAK